MAFDFNDISGLVDDTAARWLQMLNLNPAVDMPGGSGAGGEPAVNPWVNYMLGNTGWAPTSNMSMFQNLPGLAAIRARQTGGGDLWPSRPVTPNTGNTNPDPLRGVGGGSRPDNPGTRSNASATLQPQDQGQTAAYQAPAGEGVQRWAPVIQQVNSYGVPMDVAMAIMDIESHGNQDSQGAPTQWGKAQGLMQIMPFHWPAGTSEETMRNPVENIKKGLEILKKNYDTYGNWDSAAAAYFGAIDDQGRPSQATDANGVSGVQYVQRFNNARSRYTPGW